MTDWRRYAPIEEGHIKKRKKNHFLSIVVVTAILLFTITRNVLY
jgi:hypothetical protein